MLARRVPRQCLYACIGCTVCFLLPPPKISQVKLQDTAVRILPPHCCPVLRAVAVAAAHIAAHDARYKRAIPWLPLTLSEKNLTSGHSLAMRANVCLMAWQGASAAAWSAFHCSSGSSSSPVWHSLSDSTWPAAAAAAATAAAAAAAAAAAEGRDLYPQDDDQQCLIGSMFCGKDQEMMCSCCNAALCMHLTCLGAQGCTGAITFG
jgi:hypothetical protein